MPKVLIKRFVLMTFYVLFDMFLSSVGHACSLTNLRGGGCHVFNVTYIPTLMVAIQQRHCSAAAHLGWTGGKPGNARLTQNRPAHSRAERRLLVDWANLACIARVTLMIAACIRAIC